MNNPLDVEFKITPVVMCADPARLGLAGPATYLREKWGSQAGLKQSSPLFSRGSGSPGYSSSITVTSPFVTSWILRASSGDGRRCSFMIMETHEGVTPSLNARSLAGIFSRLIYAVMFIV